MKSIHDHSVFKEIDFPTSRIATFDVGKIGNKKHHVAGFLEIDISNARKKIKLLSKEKKISFFAWFIKTVSIALTEQPMVHGILKNKHKIILFDDIDISIPVERTVNGKKVPLVFLLKKSNEKSVYDIQLEIEEAKKQIINDESNYVLKEKRSKFIMRLFYSLPQFLRMIFWNNLIKNPIKNQKNMGSVIITSVIGKSNFSGWILPKSMHNLCIGLGSISKKPWVVNNNIEIRDILCLTVLFDHDVIDGVPAARFINKLVYYLENAYGIE